MLKYVTIVYYDTTTTIPRSTVLINIKLESYVPKLVKMTNIENEQELLSYFILKFLFS